jgi:hypothetical protein
VEKIRPKQKDCQLHPGAVLSCPKCDTARLLPKSWNGPKWFPSGTRSSNRLNARHYRGFAMPKLCFRRIESSCRGSVGDSESATHNATHNRSGLHVLRRTYAAVRDLQVGPAHQRTFQSPDQRGFSISLDSRISAGGQSGRIASPKSSSLHPECTPPETTGRWFLLTRMFQCASVRESVHAGIALYVGEELAVGWDFTSSGRFQ